MIRVWLIDDHRRALDCLHASLPQDVLQEIQITLFSSYEDFVQTLSIIPLDLFPQVAFIDYFLEKAWTGEDVLTTFKSSSCYPLLIACSSVDQKNQRLLDLGCHYAVRKDLSHGVFQGLSSLLSHQKALHSLIASL